jgi:hypothetical protein
MTLRIIFQNDTGGVTVIAPATKYLKQYGIEAIAQKDVPAGKPYKIVDAAGIPTDRTFRDAWEVDPAILTDGAGADSNEFPQEEVAA